MDRQLELELIDELLALKSKRAHFLDETIARNPVDHYLSEARFQLERKHIFRRLPTIAAHTSELSGAGAFLRREVAGLPVLLTRDKAGRANAFLNVCRHRGTRLVEEESGCKHRFSCPYHAWTYASSGELIAAPHFEEGFAGLQKSDLRLKRLTCEERHGFIWVTADEDSPVTLDDHLGPLGEELDALGIEDMFVAQQDAPVHAANWKILVEGGIEAYHFKVAHRATIGPYFEDNLSSYRMIGSHMRSILMRTSMTKLEAEARQDWRLRDHAQILYTIFPNTALLVQSDHIAWINQEALSAGETRVRMTTLAPNREADRPDHWKRNHAITRATLDEDFEIGESIQASIASGANDHMLFGRFEGALDAFNKVVDRQLDGVASQAVAAE
ncbi:aromatic ring-hydroxylating oxygenase subunit alpha [Henriciella algicola]|uniref:Ring-hydroxylating oxygenase subunit alpha n=1 Tax=Henriciella algicola TaxID=1608422 RepID=A0A399RG01_9PROT|nr:SRPBCC family protein [Henriciella algicola]RIJ29503.1 ring-hydroxylating oxygenase subunit alpha [Henriciella algicola]